MKPIQHLFKLAQATYCLAKEWRDSLSYTALAAYAGHGVLQNHPEIIGHALVAGAAREAIRFIAWQRPMPQFVGDLHKLDANKYVATAAVSTLGLWFLQDKFCAVVHHTVLVNPMSFPPMILGAWAVGVLYKQGSGLRDIPNHYFNHEVGMWDWPRRNGGRGPTQTQKLKESLSVLGRSLTNRLAPRPVVDVARVQMVSEPR